jgi:hypothetical protein
MHQFRYDIIAHDGGYAIVLTPETAEAFAAKHDAFDAASDLARKLRFVGVSLDVRAGQHAGDVKAKAS